MANETTELQRFETTDSVLEHGDWRFPNQVRTRPLPNPDEEDFLGNHNFDQAYDTSSVRFKLLVGNAVSANLQDVSRLPIDADILRSARDQGWISGEYEHLWKRDGGGSAALSSHGILTFILQTPRDGHSFSSLSLVNKEPNLCAGLYIADAKYGLNPLLSGQLYLNRHPSLPREFAILPFRVLVNHVDETLGYVQKLHRELASTEKRIAEGTIHLDQNSDYRLLNRLNLEHLRLQRRSQFQIDLTRNLTKYIDDYRRIWVSPEEDNTGYLEEMSEKLEQQSRYAEQVKQDLDIIPKRISNQSKAIFNFIAQRDNATNNQIAESSRAIAFETRQDNMLNLKLAKIAIQTAENTRIDGAAMKTIAIMTLTFLPGTAVASLFSMNNMFNWNPSTGESIASPYLYVFFAVTIPLTALLFLGWFWWFKRSEQRNHSMYEKMMANVDDQMIVRVQTINVHEMTPIGRDRNSGFRI